MSPVAAIVATVLSALVAQNAPAADPTTESNTSGLMQAGFIQRGGVIASGASSHPPIQPDTRDELRSDALQDPARAASGRTSTVIRQPSGYSDSKPLDLRIPDITTVFTPEQIQRILSKTFDSNLEEVEVEGQRSRIIPNTPVIPGGLIAPFWAMAHPTQAWRIFLPLPPDQAQTIGNQRFDITDPNLPPILPP